MKKILLITMSFAFALSCSTDELVDKLPLSDMELKLDEYGLFNNGKQFDGYTLGLDPNIIYFNGRSNKKLTMKSFNITDRNNLLSWQSKDDLSVEVYEGYGVNSTHIISEFKTITPYQYGDDNVFIIWGIAVGEQYAMQQRIITSDLYFTSGDKREKFESMTYPSKSYFYTKIKPWYDGSVIVSKSSASGRLVDSCFCYSVKGEELFSFKKNIKSFVNVNYIAINNTNYIEFIGGIRGTFRHSNIKDNKQVWESVMPLKDLAEDTRIDEVKFTILNTIDVLCEFNYTLFSGGIGSRDVIVKIKTGQIVVQ